MDPVTTFGWAEVAGIAGAALVCLMTFVGILLTLILRKQGTADTNGNGVIVQVREIRKSIDLKIDAETKNRKEDFKTVKEMIICNTKERRADVNLLHTKFDSGLKSVVKDFNMMCEKNQNLCGDKHIALLKGTKDKLVLTCARVGDIEKDRSRKWEGQESRNREMLSKLSHAKFE